MIQLKGHSDFPKEPQINYIYPQKMLEYEDTPVTLRLDVGFSDCPLGFVEKMRQKLYHPFSMRFEFVASIGTLGERGKDSNHFNDPNDVKISHKLQCIIVSDFNNNRLVCFHLITRKFICEFKLDCHPIGIEVERTMD